MLKTNNFNKTNGYFEKPEIFLSQNVGPYVLGIEVFYQEKLLDKEHLEK